MSTIVNIIWKYGVSASIFRTFCVELFHWFTPVWSSANLSRSSYYIHMGLFLADSLHVILANSPNRNSVGSKVFVWVLIRVLCLFFNLFLMKVLTPRHHSCGNNFHQVWALVKESGSILIPALSWTHLPHQTQHPADRSNFYVLGLYLVFSILTPGGEFDHIRHNLSLGLIGREPSFDIGEKQFLS